MYIAGLVPVTWSLAVNKFLGTPLILGSWWAFVPIGLMLPLLVFRTAKEDATLRAELVGYEEFTHQTRFRLIAGLW